MNRVTVLKLMAEGWELGVANDSRGARVSIQQGGQCKGGESRTVSWTVFAAMKKRGEIVRVQEPENQRKFWLTRYALSGVGARRNAQAAPEEKP